jgi:signal transduction histidine kinase
MSVSNQTEEQDPHKSYDSSVDATPQTERLPPNKEKDLIDDHFERANHQFKNFIGTHHLSLFVAFSILLVLGGIIFIEMFLRLASIPDPLVNLIPLFSYPLLFLTIGILLVVSPVFLDRFVLHAVRHEKGLRVRAQTSTREAGLLQDILTHDIRNYNQAVLGYAELIDQVGNGDHKISDLTSSLTNAVERSTNFVERAKLLGKIISDQDFVLRPTDLLETLRRSIRICEERLPNKKIIPVVKIGSSAMTPIESADRGRNNLNVRADPLLEEVFYNLFSNSAKYTHSDQVFIAMELNKEYDRLLRRKCWKVSISDLGEGIPDNVKISLFSRYTKGAKEANGIGMSIVHALVIGRYGGRVGVRDRVEGNYSKGAVLDVWLPIN